MIAGIHLFASAVVVILAGPQHLTLSIGLMAIFVPLAWILGGMIFVMPAAFAVPLYVAFRGVSAPSQDRTVGFFFGCWLGIVAVLVTDFTAARNQTVLSVAAGVQIAVAVVNYRGGRHGTFASLFPSLLCVVIGTAMLGLAGPTLPGLLNGAAVAISVPPLVMNLTPKKAKR